MGPLSCSALEVWYPLPQITTKKLMTWSVSHRTKTTTRSSQSPKVLLSVKGTVISGDEKRCCISYRAQSKKIEI